MGAKGSSLLCFNGEGCPRMFGKWGYLFLKHFKTVVSIDGELSKFISVKVGVHQGSALSSLLFIMVMDDLTKYVRDGSLMELLNVGDLVL